MSGSAGQVTLTYQKPIGKVTLLSVFPSDPNENWSLKLQGVDPSGKPTPLDAKKRLEFETGNRITASGTGFKPETPVIATEFVGSSITSGLSCGSWAWP